ncbi:F-box only protein 27-like [Gastrophryne carolinensis]
MDLDPLPDEVLLVILSYVPEKDLLLHCRSVSRRWKDLVDSSTVWRLKCEHDGRTEILRAALCPDLSWQKVYIKKPFSRNLLRNPCGKEGLRHWEVLNGGDGWAVENNYSTVEGAENQTCFVSSYHWCKKEQMISLLREGMWEHFLDIHQPIICISDWYAGRNDCGCIYELKVQLLADDRQTVIQEHAVNPSPIPQWNDAQYHQVYYEFSRYGPGVRYVKFVHRGRDTQFWKGWYGARITNSSVTLKCNNIEPCHQNSDTVMGPSISIGGEQRGMGPSISRDRKCMGMGPSMSLGRET